MSRGACILIGAGDGLGRSLAARFARGGYAIGLVSRTEAGSAAARAAAAAVPDARVRFVAADATRPEQLEAACARLAGELGHVAVVIYTARGGYEPRAPLDMSYAELEDIFRLEVIGALAVAKAVLPAMIARGRGTVIYSSATAAFRGSGTNPVFAIGKFGLRALSQSLAKAYARDGVHVVHVRLDCTLDVPMVRAYYGAAFKPEETANTDDVAETYWWVHEQPRSAWSNEVELRPYTENWTC
jgi:NAD(P)-dependent dehydrogenase (short-subunit alcohol dehydrogenase family)